MTKRERDERRAAMVARIAARQNAIAGELRARMVAGDKTALRDAQAAGPGVLTALRKMGR